MEFHNHTEYKISVMGSSLGASFAAWYAWEYPRIHEMLLINMPIIINWHRVKKGIAHFGGRVTIIYGDKDPSYKYFGILDAVKSEQVEIGIVTDADHEFSNCVEQFIELPMRYLLQEPPKSY